MLVFETFARPTSPQVLGWPPIAAGRNTLICAPTGSGKTLAAFLWCLDELVREAHAAKLPRGIHTLYISPLKALGYDVERNLRMPLRGIHAACRALELEPVRMPENALDVLAQHVLSATAMGPCSGDDLLRLFRRAAPYRRLTRPALDAVLSLLGGRFPADVARGLTAKLVWERSTERARARNADELLATVMRLVLLPEEELEPHCAPGQPPAPLVQQLLRDGRLSRFRLGARHEEGAARSWVCATEDLPLLLRAHHPRRPPVNPLREVEPQTARPSGLREQLLARVVDSLGPASLQELVQRTGFTASRRRAPPCARCSTAWATGRTGGCWRSAASARHTGPDRTDRPPTSSRPAARSDRRAASSAAFPPRASR